MEDVMRHLELEEERLCFRKMSIEVYMVLSSSQCGKGQSTSIKVEVSKQKRNQNLTKNKKGKGKGPFKKKKKKLQRLNVSTVATGNILLVVASSVKR